MILFGYDFYTDSYGGDIVPEADWRKYLVKSNTYLSKLMHRDPDEKNLELVQLCLCEVSEVIYQSEKALKKHSGRMIQSENTDGYSVSFSEDETVDSKICAIIRRYLASSGLLYMGVM